MCGCVVATITTAWFLLGLGGADSPLFADPLPGLPALLRGGRRGAVTLLLHEHLQ